MNQPAENKIRVRFAPSPTGALHIGGVRTALFNYLYARQQGGEFVLRIEDTDQERSKPEFEEEILDSLRWLGLNPDGEVIRQSERLERYRAVAKEFLEKGLAYEETTDGRTAIRFKMPKEKVYFKDFVRGDLAFDTTEFEDVVILKSDGFPTYHLAVVVDDHDMGITHIVRGEDHLTNTPRQVLLYKAMGWKVPKYAHLSLILGDDGSPLSKRHGAVSARAYRDEGYLPEALVNYLALLGWNPGENREIYTPEELIKKFSLKKIVKSAAKFDLQKLAWTNGQHLRALKSEDYLSRVTEFWKEDMDTDDPGWPKLAELYKPRIETLKQLKEKTAYLFSDIQYQDQAMVEGILKDERFLRALKNWYEKVKSEPGFDEKELESQGRQFAEAEELKAKDFIHPLRYILTGETATPGLFEVMALLGREKTLSRIEVFLAGGVA